MTSHVIYREVMVEDLSFPSCITYMAHEWRRRGRLSLSLLHNIMCVPGHPTTAFMIHLCRLCHFPPTVVWFMHSAGYDLYFAINMSLMINICIIILF